MDAPVGAAQLQLQLADFFVAAVELAACAANVLLRHDRSGQGVVIFLTDVYGSADYVT